MNSKEVTINLKEFWNQINQGLKPEKLTKNDLLLGGELDKNIKFLGDNCNSILDVGCGIGLMSLNAKVFGEKVNSILGVDPSENAINFAKKSCELSSINNVEFKVGDQTLLSSLKDESFEGIICSNVLDVIVQEDAECLINEMWRLLVNKGYLLVKLNFYLTEGIIRLVGLEEKEKDYYFEGEVLRAHNLTSEQWIDLFVDRFEVVEVSSFQRIENGPSDRIIMLRKK